MQDTTTNYYSFFSRNDFNIANDSIDYYKNRCHLLQQRSSDEKTREVASELVQSLTQQPEKFAEILNTARVEHFRQNHGRDSGREHFNATIQYLFSKHVSPDRPLISCAELDKNKDLLKITPPVLELIDTHSLRQTDLLKENSAFFVGLIYPEEKLDREQLIRLISTLDDFSDENLNQFFSHASNEKNQARVVQMLHEIPVESGRHLHLALKSIARHDQLSLHSWTVAPPRKYWEFSLMRSIRESGQLRSAVFQPGSLWAPADVPSQNSRGGNLAHVTKREQGLAINESYLKELRRIGGKEFLVGNPDGEKIHCMGFEASRFAQIAANELAQLELVSEVKMPDSEQLMRIYRVPKESSKNLDTLKSMGILVERPREKLEKQFRGLKLEEESEEKEKESEESENYLVMYPSQIQFSDLPEAKEPVTAVMCTGSAVWFSLYKPMIARLLMNGLNVMAFSYRGYELSEGTPTDQKVFQDLETVCHYLFTAKIDSKEQLLLYASCMGLGPAARYVKNHPDTNLLIDRSFSRLSTVAALKIPQMGLPGPAFSHRVASAVASVALPYLVNFENLTHLKGAKGQIAIVTSAQDELFPEETAELKNGMPDAHHITSPASYGHAGNWLKDWETLAALQAFLTQNGMARKMGI